MLVNFNYNIDAGELFGIVRPVNPEGSVNRQRPSHPSVGELFALFRLFRNVERGGHRTVLVKITS
jgi:hypothetical protein